MFQSKLFHTTSRYCGLASTLSSHLTSDHWRPGIIQQPGNDVGDRIAFLVQFLAWPSTEVLLHVGLTHSTIRSILSCALALLCMYLTNTMVQVSPSPSTASRLFHSAHSCFTTPTHKKRFRMGNNLRLMSRESSGSEVPTHTCTASPSASGDGKLAFSATAPQDQKKHLLSKQVEGCWCHSTLASQLVPSEIFHLRVAGTQNCATEVAS